MARFLPTPSHIQQEQGLLPVNHRFPNYGSSIHLESELLPLLGCRHLGIGRILQECAFVRRFRSMLHFHQAQGAP